MPKTKRISDVINNGSYRGLLGVAEKARKSKKRKIEPKPIGHHLAVRFFLNEEEVDLMFIDNIIIFGKRTTILHINKTHADYYYEEIESTDLDLSRLKVYYKNNTSIEIYRVN